MRSPTWLRRATALLIGLVATAAVSAPAQAAVPDVIGIAQWNGAVVASGTWPAATSVIPGVIGRYQIKFPGLAVSGGVVHVTAINPAPHWCQAESWFASGTSEIVNIRCYRVGGAPDWSPFAAFFTRSSGPGPAPYGYVDAQPTGVIVSQYNATLAANSVVPAGVGMWTVQFPNLITGGAKDGSLQATAVNSVNGARCKVGDWFSTASGQIVRVVCFDPTGAPYNTRFTLSYQHKTSLYGALYPPKNFGYLLDMPGPGPVTTNFNSQLGFGGNSAGVAGLGLTTVKLPQIGVVPDNVLVTAYGYSSNFCGMDNAWFHFAPTDTVVRNVNCFTNAGAPANTGFLISSNSIY